MGNAAEGAERSLDHRRIEPSGDEYQTRAPIPIGPRTQMPRRMYEMLYPMHRDRRCRVSDIKDALHPQQCIAMAVKQHRQPDTEPRPIDRLVEVERQSSDIIGMAMMTVGGMAMDIFRLPALYTVAIGRKQRGCIEIVFGSTPEWRDRIDVTQPLRQAIGSFGGREIGLGQNQPIGHRDLFDAFGSRVELPRAVHSVDRRYHVTEAEMVPQHRI